MPDIIDPRGIRNNNPGNIRLSETVWQGQQSFQSDPDFAVFATPLYGLRALMKTLLTYYRRYGLDTVQSLINRYAPPYENATDFYAEDVAEALNIERTDKINVAAKQTLVALARAIVMHENGAPPKDRPPGWYDTALYDQAAILALQEIKCSSL